MVLKDKKISEQGTYKELLQKKGPFQEFLLQFLTSGSEDLEDLAGEYLLSVLLLYCLMCFIRTFGCCFYVWFGAHSLNFT